MAAIDLTDVVFCDVQPFGVTTGNTQNGPAGAYHFDALGDRKGFRLETPPMRVEPHGRRLAARLARAAKQGGLFTICQPGFAVGSPGSPTISEDTAAGKLVPITGGYPGYQIVPGQWFSVVVDGQRYMDWAMEAVTLDGDGAGVIPIENLLRAPLSEGDVVELAKPKVEGSVTVEGGGWSREHLTSFVITVTEDA